MAPYHDGVVCASSVRPRDRVTLKESDAHAYTQLYSNTKAPDVFSRLVLDATFRQTRTPKALARDPDWPQQLSSSSAGKLSGFVSNSTKAVYTQGTFRVGHQSFGDEYDLARMTPQQLHRYKQKNAHLYFAQIRPDTETTNQALRLLGTYETDYFHAKSAEVNIPNCCPGGAAFFHPDVRVTGAAAAPGTVPHRFTSRPLTLLGATRRSI